jgi:hypothetical protein
MHKHHTALCFDVAKPTVSKPVQLLCHINQCIFDLNILKKNSPLYDLKKRHLFTLTDYKLVITNQ